MLIVALPFVVCAVDVQVTLPFVCAVELMPVVVAGPPFTETESTE
jgi:hypothetical protein